MMRATEHASADAYVSEAQSYYRDACTHGFIPVNSVPSWLTSCETRAGLNAVLAAARARVQGWPHEAVSHWIMAYYVGIAQWPLEAARNAAQLAIAEAYVEESAALAYQRLGGRPTRFTAAELMSMDIPAPKWLVDGVLPEGTTLLAGKPKFGKSYLCLGLAYAVAAGGKALGHVQCEQADVLYLALEGGLAGLRGRVEKMAQGGDHVPKGLHFATEWPKGNAGLEALRDYFADRPNCKLLVIDTLKHLRQSDVSRSSMYQEDYEATSSISAVCTYYGVSAVIVHHASKKAVGDTEDILDLISGSTGLVAGVDNGAVLTSTPQGAVLAVRPRDLEEVSLAVERDPHLGTWRILGDATLHAASEQQRMILQALDECVEPPQAFELAQIVGLAPDTVRRQLHRMQTKTPPLVHRQGKAWARAAPSLQQQDDARTERTPSTRPSPF